MKKSKIRTQLIYIYLKTQNISKTKFCKMCKISPKTLEKILEGDEDISLLAINRIATILNLRLHQMLDDV